MNLPPAFLPASHEPQTEDNKINMLKDAKVRGLYFSQIEVSTFVMFMLTKCDPQVNVNILFADSDIV